MAPVGAKPLSPYLDIDSPHLLADLGKDSRLVSYGGGNFGMPLGLMEPDGELIVPTDRFFLRSNELIPVIAAEDWRLTVEGHVAQTLYLRLADLEAMPQRTVTAFLECAGNGRTGCEPVPDGGSWHDDACGNAVWEGASLGDVLDLAGVQDGAVDVVSQGGDFPAMRRGLPLTVARDPDTLLVLRMNDEPLPIAHGGPVRLLVPGWAGIASTKWLIGLKVLDRAFAGFWNTGVYVYRSADGAALRPVEVMPVKSVIGTPRAGAILPAGPVDIAGYAWSGHGQIARVEISVDGGATWRRASLTAGDRRAWVRFRFRWEAAPGCATLMARATDERGLGQPMNAAWDGQGYGHSSIRRVEVSVVAETEGEGIASDA